MNKLNDGMIKSGEEQLKKVEAMIGSMTHLERSQPELLSAQPSRRNRIAKGSGHTIKDVDKVLSDFQRMRSMMKQMSTGAGMPGLGGGLPGFDGAGLMNGIGSNKLGQGSSLKRKRPYKKKKGFGDL